MIPIDSLLCVVCVVDSSQFLILKSGKSRYFLARSLRARFKPAGSARGPGPRAKPGPARAQSQKARPGPGRKFQPVPGPNLRAGAGHLSTFNEYCKVLPKARLSHFFLKTFLFKNNACFLRPVAGNSNTRRRANHQKRETKKVLTGISRIFGRRCLSAT